MKLEFNKVNKYFGSFHVLKDVSFEVNSGQIFGYLGRNGAGKTTSLRILMDVFKADSGIITIDGKPFDPTKYTIGYLPEDRGMYSKTKVKDQLVYFAMLRGASKSDALKSVLDWTKRFEIEKYLDKKLETLSKGNQQKVQITQAFLNEPDILILDEPFSGLDPVNSQLFQDALAEYIADDKIIIFSSHQMSYVETFCDDIALINFGEIVLKGNLEAIKKEIGGSKLRLNATHYDLKSFLIEKGQDVSSDATSLIVNFNSGYNQNEFLKDVLQEGIELDLLTPYKPSLQEIFINKVGEHHE